MESETSRVPAALLSEVRVVPKTPQPFRKNDAVLLDVGKARIIVVVAPGDSPSIAYVCTLHKAAVNARIEAKVRAAFAEWLVANAKNVGTQTWWALECVLSRDAQPSVIVYDIAALQPADGLADALLKDMWETRLNRLRSTFTFAGDGKVRLFDAAAHGLGDTSDVPTPHVVRELHTTRECAAEYVLRPQPVTNTYLVVGKATLETNVRIDLSDKPWTSLESQSARILVDIFTPKEGTISLERLNEIRFELFKKHGPIARIANVKEVYLVAGRVPDPRQTHSDGNHLFAIFGFYSPSSDNAEYDGKLGLSGKNRPDARLVWANGTPPHNATNVRYAGTYLVAQFKMRSSATDVRFGPLKINSVKGFLEPALAMRGDIDAVPVAPREADKRTQYVVNLTARLVKTVAVVADTAEGTGDGSEQLWVELKGLLHIVAQKLQTYTVEKSRIAFAERALEQARKRALSENSNGANANTDSHVRKRRKHDT